MSDSTQTSKSPMNQFSRNLALWLVLALLVLLVVNMFQGQQTRDREIGYSQFVAELKAGRVDEVTVQGDVTAASSG